MKQTSQHISKTTDPGAVAHLLLLRHRSLANVLALYRRLATLTGGYSIQLCAVEAQAIAAERAAESRGWQA